MAADEDAEKELIALSKDQRAFFEKIMPGMKLYPFQERMIEALLNFKGKIIIGLPRRGKTLVTQEMQKLIDEHKTGEKCPACEQWTYNMEPGSFNWTEPERGLA